jgi:hypothetical protein
MSPIDIQNEHLKEFLKENSLKTLFNENEKPPIFGRFTENKELFETHTQEIVNELSKSALSRFLCDIGNPIEKISSLPGVIYPISIRPKNIDNDYYKKLILDSIYNETGVKYTELPIDDPEIYKCYLKIGNFRIYFNYNNWNNDIHVRYIINLFKLNRKNLKLLSLLFKEKSIGNKLKFSVPELRKMLRPKFLTNIHVRKL